MIPLCNFLNRPHPTCEQTCVCCTVTTYIKIQMCNVYVYACCCYLALNFLLQTSSSIIENYQWLLNISKIAQLFFDKSLSIFEVHITSPSKYRYVESCGKFQNCVSFGSDFFLIFLFNIKIQICNRYVTDFYHRTSHICHRYQIFPFSVQIKW